MTGRHLKPTPPDTQTIENATKPRTPGRHVKTQALIVSPKKYASPKKHADITPPRYVADLRKQLQPSIRRGPRQYRGD
jgi:hypothetical protein